MATCSSGSAAGARWRWSTDCRTRFGPGDVSRAPSESLACARMSAAELMWLHATEQARLVRGREAAAAELVEAAIERIEATRTLNAVILDQFDRAYQMAAGPLPDGPFAGVPFLLKDLGADMEGVPSAMGSRAFRRYVPSATAWTVQRYLDAGLV